MSKELNGAELLQLAIDGKIKEGDKFIGAPSGLVAIYKDGIFVDEGYPKTSDLYEIGCSELLGNIFARIQEPVCFEKIIEVCDEKKIKVDISGIDFTRSLHCYDEKLNSFDCLTAILKIIFNNFYSCEIKQIIKEGKWYIEEE